MTRRDPSTEDALRRSLAEHARLAPDGDPLAERIIASLDRPARSLEEYRETRRSARLLPLLAAAVVAAVVGGVALVAQLHDSGTHHTAQATRSVVRSSTHSQPRSQAPRPSGGRLTRGNQAPVDTSTLHGVKVVDLTFAGADDGWALATANCIRSSGRCPALLRTHDGQTWRSMNGVAFNVPGQTGGCAYPCVDHLRFATDQIGYAFGPTALLMTTDGGLHWTTQPGLGATDLETLNGNVILIEAGGGYQSRFLRADVGSSTWASIRAPGTAGVEFADQLGLARGQHTVAASFSHYDPGKGDALSQRGALWVSTDDGANWVQRAEPCPNIGSDLDSTTRAAVAPDGAVVVACSASRVSGHTSVPLGGSTVVSTNGAKSFNSSPVDHRLGAEQLLAAASVDVQLVVTAPGRLYRTTDGGQSWSLLPYRNASFLGFESSKVGRMVLGDNTILTTRNAGATWTKARIG